jgi:zeaxanthin epoxidase
MSSAVCVTTTVGATRCARKTTTTTTTTTRASGGDSTGYGRRGGGMTTVRGWALRRRRAAVAVRSTTTEVSATSEGEKKNGPEVLVAGGGIAGLIAAAACRRKGMKVKVFEKVKKYEPFGGPIQLQCNAQGALDSIDPVMAEEVMEKGIITGDRVNGLLDGVSGEWFYRFDTRKPCHENGLPLTLVLSRFELLDILSRGVGEENIEMGTVVEKYEHRGDKVVATLTDGREFTGDVLIGADGIRSKLRAQMRGSDPENPPLAYAGYAVYTAVCKYSQPHREPKHTDPNKVGYQVFLGPKQYFVSSDVGNGEQQYYAFLEVPAGGDDEFAKCEKWENYREMLIDRFQGWAPAVMERLECTRPEDVERRDVNDIIPDPRWVDGRMALLGDSAHAVQPNLGQGGGQAIESAYVLADELSKCEGGKGVQKALMVYAARRFLRTGAIHGLSRFSSLMNTFYRRHLGDEPYGFYPEPVRDMWNSIAKAKIPHPGSVVGQIALIGTMPIILEYVGAGYGIPAVLGGASTGNGKDRVPRSQIPGISAPKRDLTAEDFKMRGIPGFAK